MSWHIVGTLASVNERHRFRANQIHRCFHVDSNIRICVFVDRQAGRSVLNEYLQHSNAKLLQFGKCVNNMPRN